MTRISPKRGRTRLLLLMARGRTRNSQASRLLEVVSPFAATFEDTEGVRFDDTDQALRRHAEWCSLFRELCEFKVQFGHCIVPQLYSDNPKLGNWVSTQRKNYRLCQEGKPSRLTPFEHSIVLDSRGGRE